MRVLRSFAFVLLLAAAVLAQDTAKFREYMDAAARVENFSGTVLVARKGHPIFEQSYGMADREKNVSNTNATEYAIGSMSKSIAATAVMMLRDQGKLSVDDSVCKYLSPCPDAWKPVLLKHLLTHTSGVADIVKFSDFPEFRAKSHTPQQLVTMIAAHPVDFAPGAKFVYSNSNFILLGAVVENVSGVKYEDFLRKNLFPRANMHFSGYQQPAKNMAKGYFREDHKYREPEASDQSVRFAAGGLYSTAGDLVELLRSLAAGKVLNPATVDEMWTDRGNGYGYGWFIENDHNRRAVGHNGRIDGFASSFRLFRDEDLVIIVLSNTNGTNTERMSAALDAIAHGEAFRMPKEHKFVTVPAAILAHYDGKYRLPWGLVLVVTHEGDTLFGRAEQEKRSTEWKAESETQFYVPPADVEITFERDANGKVTLVFDGSARAEKLP